MFALVDPKDVVYAVIGIAFFGLTILPLLCGVRLLSIPTLYVTVGALLAWSPLAVPVFDPQSGDFERLLIEHLTELIVIIALAGAGLAVDRKLGRKEWHHTWYLLGLVMPLSIVTMCVLGYYSLGLPLASALLLASALAPTDPVLARSVQVSAPTKGEEDDVRVSLTTEAGLNDGLAFPFVYLAITLAAIAGAAEPDAVGALWWWFGWDVVYRVGVGLLGGWAMGKLFARLVFSSVGDAGAGGGENAGLVMVATTFIIYGVVEAFDGYGFLAVFIGALSARSFTRGREGDDYVLKPHFFSDQLEKILLALLLIWLGCYAASGVLDSLRWQEVLVAILLIGLVRPLFGYLCLLPTRGTRLEKLSIGGFGIRGLGSFFYIAYAAGHGDFAQLDVVWRTTIVTVLLSILIHGVLAPVAMNRLERRGQSNV